MRFFVAVVLATAMLVLATSAALAGEVTGNGTLKTVQGNSPCAYSGQEDLQYFTDDGDHTAKPPTKGSPSHAQSWGQIVSANGGHLGGANSTMTPDGPWGCNARDYGLKIP
jgi:hypothetical protein